MVCEEVNKKQERHKQLTDDDKLQIIKPNHKRFSLGNHLEIKKGKLRPILDKKNGESDFFALPFRILS